MPKGKSVDSHPITLHGVKHVHGIGTHAFSEVTVDLKGNASKFEADIGVDDEVGQNGSVVFEAWVDNKRVYDSGVLHGGGEPRHIEIPLTGAKHLLLTVTDAGDGMDSDHADWAMRA